MIKEQDANRLEQHQRGEIVVATSQACASA